MEFKLSQAISRQAEQGRVEWNENNKWKCKDLPDIPIRTHLVSANKPFVFCLSSRTPTSRQSAFADYYQIQVKFWRKISLWNKERNLIFRWAMNQDTWTFISPPSDSCHIYSRMQPGILRLAVTICSWLFSCLDNEWVVFTEDSSVVSGLHIEERRVQVSKKWKIESEQECYFLPHYSSHC